MKSKLVAAFQECDRTTNSKAVTSEFLKRINLCLEKEGGHFERRTRGKKDQKLDKKNDFYLQEYTYIHVRDKSTNEVNLVLGPEHISLTKDQELVGDVASFIRVPSYHVALILYEGRVERRLSTEPFPLFPMYDLIHSFYSECRVSVSHEGDKNHNL